MPLHAMQEHHTFAVLASSQCCNFRVSVHFCMACTCKAGEARRRPCRRTGQSSLAVFSFRFARDISPSGPNTNSIKEFAALMHVGSPSVHGGKVSKLAHARDFSPCGRPLGLMPHATWQRMHQLRKCQGGLFPLSRGTSPGHCIHRSTGKATSSRIFYVASTI